MKEALREKSFGAFVVGGDIDVDETETTVQNGIGGYEAITDKG